MRKTNIALHIALGLTCLAFISIFIPVGQSIVAAISIATLLFTIAQAIESYLRGLYENMRESVDVNKLFGSIDLSEEQMAFCRLYIKYDDSGMKNKLLGIMSTVLNSLAFAVLFIGLVVQVSIPAKITAAVAIFSAAILFFSLWLLEKQNQRMEQWEELKLLGLAMQNTNHTNAVNEEAAHD